MASINCRVQKVRIPSEMEHFYIALLGRVASAIVPKALECQVCMYQARCVRSTVVFVLDPVRVGVIAAVQER